MARVVFVTWDGGGNVSVALGIARALVERDHDVTVLGPASLRRAIEKSGLAFAPLGVSPPPDASSRAEYLLDVSDRRASLRACVAELGFGIALSHDATAEEIGAAVKVLLDDSAYRQRARTFKRRCG